MKQEINEKQIKLNLWPCRDCDYYTHSISFSAGEPIEEIIARAAKILSDCCLEEDGAAEIARKVIEQYFTEQKEKEEKKAAAEDQEDKIREVARQTGKEQLLKQYQVMCDGSVCDCDWDIIREFVYPDGSIKKQRIHTF